MHLVSLGSEKQLEDAKDALKKSMLATKQVGRQRYQSAMRQKNRMQRNRPSQARTSVDFTAASRMKPLSDLNVTTPQLLPGTTQHSLSRAGFCFSPLSSTNKTVFSKRDSLSKQISTDLKS